MDEKQRAEALWAYSITQERIMERLVRKGSFTRKQADEILDMLIAQLSEEDIERHSNSAGCKETLQMLLHPNTCIGEYISLTEIARAENSDAPGYIIQSWLRSRNTFDFLRIWENNNNSDFKDNECNQLFEKLKTPSFTLTPKKWITLTNAKGIVSKQGNSGGTLAHRDIALDFQLWLKPEKRYEMVQLVGDILNKGLEKIK